MSTTTGADTALDLDAIEARANAALDGPWYTVYSDYADEVSIRQDESPRVWGAYVEVAESHQCDDGDSPTAEFIAAARTDVPALVAEVRRLRPRVISGDVEAVTAALDGLPVGSIITCDDGEGGDVYFKRRFAQMEPRWYEPGFSMVIHVDLIARHQVPITVLREGTEA